MKTMMLVFAAALGLGVSSAYASEDVAIANTQFTEMPDEPHWRAADLAKKVDVACATVHVKEQYPAEGIIAAAKEKGCDLIVMASHGRRGLAKLLLGSEATKVLALSSVPVLICR